MISDRVSRTPYISISLVRELAEKEEDEHKIDMNDYRRSRSNGYGDHMTLVTVP